MRFYHIFAGRYVTNIIVKKLLNLVVMVVLLLLYFLHIFYIQCRCLIKISVRLSLYLCQSSMFTPDRN